MPTNRQISVECALGKDELLFRHMTAVEELGRPFTFQVDLLSKNNSIKLEDVLGKSMTIVLELPDGGKRYFNGYPSYFAQTGTRGNYVSYHAVLRPWLWFLTRGADCRIFPEDKKVPEIIKSVFSDLGFSDYKDSLSGTYRDWNYCVQYRETHFDFVSRLMEQEGIYYYFTHTQGKHTLVLADDYGAHDKQSGYGKIPYFPPDEHQRRERDHISKLEVAKQIETGSYVLDDYDFERPQTDLKVTSTVKRRHAYADFEIYDYPGEYVQTKDGDAYAKTRIQELQAQHERVRGGGDVEGLRNGALFELEGFPRDDQNREYLVVHTRHELTSHAYETSDEGGGLEVSCEFEAMDSQQRFRSPRVTPVPIVRGPQTAVVVGPKGQEIYTDKYGRVKVQFHWDRYGKQDENSSCWIRVAQIWAGKQWGAIHIPRIGQEVIVEFLEGDPDRPIITGRVYNAEQKVPYALKANQTQSGLKSRSTLKGGADNFNELRFEDKKGEEEVYFHAEKDFTRVVENDDSLKVGFDKKDKGDQSVEIYNDRTTTLKMGNDKLEIKKGKRDLIVQQDHNITVKAGNQTVKVNAGKTLHQAAQSITLKVGASSIKIEPAKITIKSAQILIQGEATLDAKSPMTTVSGDGILTLKGGLVKIN